MGLVRDNFADILAPGFRQIFFERFAEVPPEYTELFNMNTSSVQYEDDSYVTDFGLIPRKAESAGVTYDEVFQGYDKRYTHETFSLAYRVSEEMAEDERYGIMAKLPASLGRSARNTLEQEGANLLNNAFSTSYLGGDGSAFMVTDHPLVGGGTQKNILTTAADLSEASLKQAFIDIAATTDDRGKLIRLMPKTLFVHPSGEWEARKLLESAQVIGSANNDINPAQGQVELKVNHFLTDADAWFIKCDTHEANWFWRVLPDHQQANDFDNGDAKFKIRFRFSKGWSLPWGWFGSPGAA